MPKYLVRVLMLSVVVACNAVSASTSEQSPDRAYMETIQAYVTSITSYRLSVKYVGEAHREVYGHGTVPYDINGTYKVLSDRSRGIWKLEIHEERAPQGKMDSDDFKALYAKESRTINKTKDGTTEYLHKDIDFGNYAVLYGQHQERDQAFKFQMQTLDPMRYVLEATRNQRCELIDVVQQDGGHVVITYRIGRDSDMLKRIELSKEYSFLPVRISGMRRSGETISDISLAYIQGHNGPLVKTITYMSKSGKGAIDYTLADYNPEIPDAEFNIDIPFGAMVLDHEGRVLAHHFKPEVAMSEVLDNSMVQLAEESTGFSNRLATQNDTGKVTSVPESTASPHKIETRKAAVDLRYGIWIAAIVGLCVGIIAIWLLVKSHRTRSH